MYFLNLGILLYLFIGIRAFPDIAKIQITKPTISGDYYCEIKKHSFIKSVSCSDCQIDKKKDPINIKSTNMITVNVQVSEGNFNLQIPFDRNCFGPDENYHKIDKFSIISTTNSINIKLEDSVYVNKYQILVINKNGDSSSYTTTDTEYQINKLEEKNEFLICVATIDFTSKETSQYTCNETRTDFTETGPVTNFKQINKTQNSISMSWNKPVYKYDNPEAYLINVMNINSRVCKSVLQKLKQEIKGKVSSCGEMKEIMLNEPFQVTIDQLDSYTQYLVINEPINENRKSIRTSLTMITAEGKSGPVTEYRMEQNGNKLTLEFNKPQRPNGIIKRYFIYLQNKTIDVCGNDTLTIRDKIIENTRLDLEYNKCQKFKFIIIPENGYGRGEKVDGHFTTLNDPVRKIQTTVEFVSNNLVKINWKVEEFGDCDIRVVIIQLAHQPTSQKLKQFNVYSTNMSCWKERVEKTSNEVEDLYGNVDIGHVYSYWSLDAIEITIKVMTSDGEIHHNNAPVSITKQGISGIENCFTDCYSRGSYVGIRSATKTGVPCVKWKSQTKYPSITKQSNWCTIESGSTPWCVVENSYDYCKVPKCDNIKETSGCAKVSTSSTISSISAKWAYPGDWNLIGTIVLIYNTANDCLKYSLHGQTKNTVLDNNIQSFYLSCKEKLNVDKEFEVEFTNLHNDNLCNIYIIPILNNQNSGSIRNVTEKTKLAKPNQVRNLKTYDSGNIESISIMWDESEITAQNGAAENYEISLYKDQNFQRTETTVNNYISFDLLKECSNFCVSVVATNKAGSSSQQKLCFRTLAPKLGNLELLQVKDGRESYKAISWKYLGDDKCPKSYTLEIRNTFEEVNDYKVNLTDTSYSYLINKFNSLFEYNVTMMSIFETTNKVVTKKSQTNKFYTGNKKTTLDDFKHKLNRKSRIMEFIIKLNDEDVGGVFEYEIIIQDKITNKCAKRLKIKNIWKNNKKNNFFKNILKKNMIKQADTYCTKNQTDEINKYLLNSSDIRYNWTLNVNINNYSLSLFAQNYYGWSLLQNQTKTFALDKSASIMTITVILFCIVIFLLLIVLLYIEKKRGIISKNIANLKKSNNHSSSVLVETGTNQKSEVKMKKVTKSSENNNGSIEENGPKIEPKKKSHFIQITKFDEFMKKATNNNNAELIAEYKGLNTEAKELAKRLGLSTTAGAAACNSKKNRFTNILPYDQTRIKLEGKPYPQNYINANKIPFVNDEDKMEYLASQGPIENSIEDFCQMIWEQNIDCIVMLTQTTEDGKYKCSQYWPDSITESVEFGESEIFEIKLEKEHSTDAFIERNLVITNLSLNESRSIIHLQMHTWSDYSAPNLNYFDKLLFRFQELTNKTIHPPFMIHCSAGVGRTGTFISLDRLIRQLVDGATQISIYDTVMTLRHYRTMMVQRQAQYVFIHEYLDHFLKKYMQKDTDDVYFNEEEE